MINTEVLGSFESNKRILFCFSVLLVHFRDVAADRIAWVDDYAEAESYALALWQHVRRFVFFSIEGFLCAEWGSGHQAVVARVPVCRMPRVVGMIEDGNP